MEDSQSDFAQDACTLTATVRGRVQNVGFRAFVYDNALRLRLRGYTRNNSDGSVRVVVTGPRPQLDTLLGQLQRGPLAARVERVDTDWANGESPGLPSRFEVWS